MSDLTTATPLASKDSKIKDKQLRKEQKRLRKEQKREMKQQDKLLKKGHHEAPLATGTGLGATSTLPVTPGAPVVHEAERVIQHQPLVEKEIINERPVQVKHEHHVQPVVHETEHRIQPIVRAQATTERPVIETDKNVMLPPIVEPPRMVGSTLAAPSIAPATPTLPATAPFPATARTAALPMGGYPHHLFMHPHHYYGHPYLHHQHAMGYMPPLMQRGFGGPMGGGGMDAEERMGLGVVAPLMPGEREILIEGVGSQRSGGGGLLGRLHLGHSHNTATSHHDGPVTPNTDAAPGMSGVETTMHQKASVGQKLRGAVKEVQGAVTRNPAKKEEGKMLMHGVDPATAASSTGAGF